MAVFVKKKVGVFGGTFDPIHLGHLCLALDVYEKAKLDEIIFCPAFCSPHKQKTPPQASKEDRLKMVELALSKRKDWKVSSIELEKAFPSYTVDTLKAFQSPSHELYFLLSEEHIPSFHNWKDPEEILALAQPLVGVRGQMDQKSIQHLPKDWQGSFEKGWVFSRSIGISSTEIRARIRLGKSVEYFLPEKVLNYIHKKKLYL